MGNQRGGSSLVEEMSVCGSWCPRTSHRSCPGGIQEGGSGGEELPGDKDLGVWCRGILGSITCLALPKCHLLGGSSLTFLSKSITHKCPVPFPGFDFHPCFNHDPTTDLSIYFFIVSLHPLKNISPLRADIFVLFSAVLPTPWHIVGLQQYILNEW